MAWMDFFLMDLAAWLFHPLPKISSWGCSDWVSWLMPILWKSLQKQPASEILGSRSNCSLLQYLQEQLPGAGAWFRRAPAESQKAKSKKNHCGTKIWPGLYLYIPESSNNKNILVVLDFQSFWYKFIELIDLNFFLSFWKVCSRSFREISIPNSYQWIFSNWRMYSPKTFCMVLVDAKSGWHDLEILDVWPIWSSSCQQPKPRLIPASMNQISKLNKPNVRKNRGSEIQNIKAWNSDQSRNIMGWWWLDHLSSVPSQYGIPSGISVGTCKASSLCESTWWPSGQMIP